MTLTAGPLRYILFATVCAGTFTLGAAGGLLHDDGTISEGLYIDRWYVGGLTQAQAKQKVEQEMLKLFPAQVELASGKSRWILGNLKFSRRVELDKAVREAYERTRRGGRLTRAKKRLALAEQGESVPLTVICDKAKLQTLLGQMAESIDREPRDARVSNVVADQPYFEPEQEGLHLNVMKTAEKIVDHGAFPAPGQVDMVVEATAPKVRLAELRANLNTVLAGFKTSMSDGYYGVMRENRAHNVGLLVARMKGKVLLPGEQWSFNGDLGERKVEDGFKSSVIFVRHPDGTIEERWSTGGGICQLATTIFNAALLANLKITERGNHSKTVHYAKVGRDATVYYGSVDLKIVNSLTHPIALWGELRSNYDLVISVLGDQSDDYDVTLDSDSWNGAAGRGASLWRTVKRKDGTVVHEREKICDSFYPYAKQKEETAD